jgi:glycosyltransferase involved in cell wall biosynthesis
MRRPPQHYTLFRSVMPSWDNTARKKGDAHVYHGANPGAYARWLGVAAARAQTELPPDRRFVFINAWNEWGEGCHLEPDDLHGLAYLQATRDVIAHTSRPAGQPLVSVIVPTYNRAEQLSEALLSIVEQSYEPIEIVVVNDGSTDDTIGAVAAFRSCHPRYVIRLISKPNGGAHAALNDGIRAAAGEYIAILNDDDRFPPDRIARMLKALQSSDARFAFARCAYIDDRGAAVGPEHALARVFRAKQDALLGFPAIGYALLDYNVTISTGNFFMERSLFDDVGDFAPLRYCHDWDFVLRSLRFGDPLFVDRILYEYRFHGSNQFGVLQGVADSETQEVLRRFFAQSAALAEQPPLYPSESNFPSYHERFVVEHGYAKFVPSGARPRLAAYG